MAHASVSHIHSPLGTRLVFVALALGTIAVGLLVHWRGTWLPATLRDLLGDALWAMMIAWWLGALAPNARPAIRAGLAFALCWAVEFSQLYHAPALDGWRLTMLGQVVLGTGFDPRDLGAYALGVLATLMLERTMRRRLLAQRAAREQSGTQIAE